MAAQFIFGCAICSDPFDVNKNVCTTRCGHMYHVKCIHTWLSIQHQQAMPTNCPKCRTPVRGTMRLYLHEVSSSPETISDTDNFSDIDTDSETKDEVLVIESDTEHESNDGSDTETETIAETDDDALLTFTGDEADFFIDPFQDQQEPDLLQDYFSDFMQRYSYDGSTRALDLLVAMERHLDVTMEDIHEMYNTVDVLASGISEHFEHSS